MSFRIHRVALTLSWISQGHSSLKRRKSGQCLNIHVNLNDTAAQARFCCSTCQCYLRRCILLQIFTPLHRSSLRLLLTLHSLCSDMFQIFFLWPFHSLIFESVFFFFNNLIRYLFHHRGMLKSNKTPSLLITIIISNLMIWD